MSVGMGLEFAQIDKRLREINFRLRKPEPINVQCVLQEKVTVMGVVVKVFTYEVSLAAVPEDSDAIAQVLAASGVFVDVENTAVDTLDEVGPEANVVMVKGVEGNQVSLVLSYKDEVGNISTVPQTVEFVVVDGIAPDVPEGAMTVAQVAQETVELPDVEPPVE